MATYCIVWKNIIAQSTFSLKTFEKYFFALKDLLFAKRPDLIDFKKRNVANFIQMLVSKQYFMQCSFLDSNAK